MRTGLEERVIMAMSERNTVEFNWLEESIEYSKVVINSWFEERLQAASESGDALYRQQITEKLTASRDQGLQTLMEKLSAA